MSGTGTGPCSQRAGKAALQRLGALSLRFCAVGFSALASALQEPQEVTFSVLLSPSSPRIPSRKYHDLLSRLRDPGEILLLFETASPYSPGWSELAVYLLSLWVAGITGVCHQVCPSVNPQLRLELMTLPIKSVLSL